MIKRVQMRQVGLILNLLSMQSSSQIFNQKTYVKQVVEGIQEYNAAVKKQSPPCQSKEIDETSPK